MLSRYKVESYRRFTLFKQSQIVCEGKKNAKPVSGQHIFERDLKELKAITCLVNIGFHVSRSINDGRRLLVLSTYPWLAVKNKSIKKLLEKSERLARIILRLDIFLARPLNFHWKDCARIISGHLKLEIDISPNPESRNAFLSRELNVQKS